MIHNTWKNDRMTTIDIRRRVNLKAYHNSHDDRRTCQYMMPAMEQRMQKWSEFSVIFVENIL